MKSKRWMLGFLVFAAIVTAAPGKKKVKAPEPVAGDAVKVLWRDPTDIASRNLFYGSGGAGRQPQGPYKFVREDMEGTNPKFDVTDANGVAWKVKMGVEVRSETAATRLTWSVGYFTTDDYYMAEIQVQNMPPKLRRGWKMVGDNGTIHSVRLKRADKKEEKKQGIWEWRQNPFLGTRELNGLKALMATLNNWDLKDINNAIFSENGELVYVVSDLGAAFGTAGPDWPHSKAKDNLDSFMRSKFVKAVTADHVDFNVPARPRWLLAVNPREYMKGVHLEWVCRGVPRQDARWMGQMLGRLSPDQIRDAFRAAGYTPEEVNAFTSILRERIAVLTDL